MFERIVAPRLRAATVESKVLANLALASLLSPMAVCALALSMWALGAQMTWASAFPIGRGLLSDWRMWLTIAGLLEAGAVHIRSRR